MADASVADATASADSSGGAGYASSAKAAPEAKKTRPRNKGPLYVIEHMEEGLEEWCRLEYRHICKIVPTERVLFLRFPAELDVTPLTPPGGEPPRTAPERLEASGAVSHMPPWDRACLLDMAAEEALQPDDCKKFDALVFGGILGNITEEEDGSYGSDDRTAELRKLGFAHRRHLGPMQMTTDTAVLVSHMVLEEARPLAEIPFLDSPEMGGSSSSDAAAEDSSKTGGKTCIEEAEDCVCMEGFRYVARRGADGDWEPTLPEGMKELLMRSADDDILGSL